MQRFTLLCALIAMIPTNKGIAGDCELGEFASEYMYEFFTVGLESGYRENKDLVSSDAPSLFRKKAIVQIKFVPGGFRDKVVAELKSGLLTGPFEVRAEVMLEGGDLEITHNDRHNYMRIVIPDSMQMNSRGVIYLNRDGGEIGLPISLH